MTLTPAGTALEQRLFAGLHGNMSRAYAASGEDAVAGYWTIMQNLMSDDVQRQFAAFHAAPHPLSMRGAEAAWDEGDCGAGAAGSAPGI